MKILVIRNPHAKIKGRGDVCRALKNAVPESHIDLCYTASPDHARSVAASAEIDGYDIVVAVGGDGTVNQIANGLAGTRVSLGIIPAGTANDLARHYGLPGAVSRAAEIIAQNHVREIDLVGVNGRYYATAGGVGLPCQVAGDVNDLRNRGAWGRMAGRVFGSLLYIGATLRAIAGWKNRHNVLMVTCNGRWRVFDALAVMVDNQPRLGGRFRMSPGAHNDDGFLDVCLIENSKSRMQVLDLLMRTIWGTHVRLPWVSTIRTTRLTIDSERPEPYFGDGEIFGITRHFEIKIAPGALKLLVPEDREAGHDN